MPNEAPLPHRIDNTPAHTADAEHVREAAEHELRTIFLDVKPSHVAFILPQIDYSVFGEFAARTQRACETLQQWLRIPYRTDCFGADHDKRREWRRDFRARYGKVGIDLLKIWSENKYRGNVIERPNVFINGLQIAFEDTAGLEELGAQLGEVWDSDEMVRSLAHSDTMELEERERLIQNVENRVVAVLECLVKYAEGKPTILHTESQRPGDMHAAK